jgi:adenylate cyclase
VNTILVVDDEPDLEALILRKFRHAVREGSMAFVFARDGVEALERIAEQPGLDLVLTDINMPRMDGLTLLAKLREQPDPPATVIVSAYGDMANIRTAMNRGAFDFLTKPIDLADLEATVLRTLREVAARREAQARRIAAERAHASLARYFSPPLAAVLAAEDRPTALVGQRREVTAVFTDIAGFTTLVETMDPATLGTLLNAYFGGLTEIAFAYGGTVTKIMGDATLLLFGAPDAQPDHAARAVSCALAMDAFAERLRADWHVQGITLGATRIGLHSGEALVGDFGGGRHFDYTAYGDTINVAARLEAANKALGTRVCASQAVAERIPGFQGRPAGDLVLRGRSEPLPAWEPLPSDVFASPATASYGEAFARLRARDAAAMPAFAALVGRAAEDGLAGFHLRRLLNGGAGTVVDLR